MTNHPEQMPTTPALRGGVLGIQQRMREIGRIRIGTSTPRGNGKIPQRSDTFILTSSDQKVLEAAAQLYGGAVEPWERGFRLITKSIELNIYMSPVPITQHMELWEKGGCTRRCNGQWDELRQCECDCPISDQAKLKELSNKGQACKLVTRLSVILCDLPGVGVWRIDTSSYYAASELPMTAMQLQIAASQGRMIAGRLAAPLRQRVSGGQTKVFPVLEIRVDLTPAAIVAQMEQGALAAPADVTTGELLPPAAPSLPNGNHELKDWLAMLLNKSQYLDFQTACKSKELGWELVAETAREEGAQTSDQLYAVLERLAGALL